MVVSCFLAFFSSAQKQHFGGTLFTVFVVSRPSPGPLFEVKRRRGTPMVAPRGILNAFLWMLVSILRPCWGHVGAMPAP